MYGDQTMKTTLKAFAIITTFLLVIPALARAEYHDTVEKSFDVGSGGTLTVTSDLGSITVQSHSSETVDIEIEQKIKASRSKAEDILEDIDISFDKRGDDVFLNIEWDRPKRLHRVNISQKIEVRVPERYNLDLKTSGGGIRVSDLDGFVKARTSGGGISVGNVSGQVSCNTSGGGVTVGDAGGDVKIVTSGGGITLRHVEGAVDVKTSGGGIEIEEAYDCIDATTSGGPIRATLANQPRKDCRLNTSGGGITLSLSRDINADIDARTSGGNVRTNMPITVTGKIDTKHIKGKINDGGPLVYLRTSGGSIHIDEL